MIEDNNDMEDELDSNILDDELIDEDNNIAGTIENDVEDNISDDQDIDLMNNMMKLLWMLMLKIMKIIEKIFNIWGCSSVGRALQWH